MSKWSAYWVVAFFNIMPVEAGVHVQTNDNATLNSLHISSITWPDGTVQVSSPSAGGSGTVNSGTAGQIAYYASSANAVSSLSTLAYASNVLTFAGASDTRLSVAAPGGNQSLLDLSFNAGSIIRFTAGNGNLTFTDVDNLRNFFQYTGGSNSVSFPSSNLNMNLNNITNVASLVSSSITLTGYFQAGSKPHAAITALTPSAVGQIYQCSDCSTVPVCISTGTSVGAWSLITNSGSLCQ